jgi:hypothetical protein
MTNEDECSVCGHWPAHTRWICREILDRIPLSEDICVECELSFWRNIGLDKLFAGGQQPTKQ